MLGGFALNDPHVNAIYFNLITDETLTFENCRAIIQDETTYKLSLENNILMCEFKTHFSDIGSAQKFIIPILRAWELDSALKFGREEFHFSYKDADVVDRNPSPGSVSVNVSASCAICAMCTHKIHVSKSTYPTPPLNFVINPDVETLWFRYNMYLQGKELLTSMAYFCLSFLEGLAGKRSKISTIYYIERDVIDKLGDLTSAKGDLKTTRKGKDHKFLPLSDNEKRWIEFCVKTIIRRLGESAPKPSMITMSDLPKL
jgi:hypothetical protein